MYCRECGKPVGEGQSFCKYCGATTLRTEIPGGSPAGGQPYLPRKPRRTALIVAIVAGVLILVGGGTVAAIALLRGESSPPRGSVTGTTFTPPSTEPATGGGSAPSTATRLPRDYTEALINLEEVLGMHSENVTQLTEQVAAAGQDPPQSLYDALGASLDQVEAARVELVGFEVPEEYVEADSFLLDAAVMLEDRCQLTLMGIEELWGSGDAAAAEGYFSEAQAADRSFQEAFDNYFQALPTV